MSVIVHPDGYYQITAFHDIQDVSPGSIMWKLWRGINERNAVAFRPYQKFAGGEVLEAGSIDDAIIAHGSNLQSVALWRWMQINVYVMRFNFSQNHVAPCFVSEPASGEEYNQLTIPPVPYSDMDKYAHDGAAARTDDYIRADDILGIWLVNDLLRMLYPLRWVKLRADDTPEKGESNALSGSGAGCEYVDQEARADWMSHAWNTFFQGYHYQVHASISSYPSGPFTGYQHDRSMVRTTSPCTVTNPYDFEMVMHAVCENRGFGGTFAPLNGRDIGFFTTRKVATRSIQLTSEDLGVDYGDAYPNDVLGVNCENQENKGFSCEAQAYGQCLFSDIPA